MRILLVEDHLELSHWLAKALRDAHLTVETAHNGADADALLHTQEYSLVLLDLSLPKMDGLDVLRRLRARGGTRGKTPVMILTARGGLDEKVQGLNLGADDYMAKPFELAELEARVKALLRRSQGNEALVHTCGALSFDTVTRMFSYAGAPFPLTPREHAVLEALITRSGRAVSKEKLFDEVFALADDANLDAIELYIHRVRKKLENGVESGSPDGAVITTLRGIGYLLQPRSDGAGRVEMTVRTARTPLFERLRRRWAQGRPLGSLRSQLLRWLLIPLVMLVLLDAVFVYRNALDAADMAYDRSLLASTRALAERVSIVNGKVVAEVPYVALDSFETDTLGRIYYKVTGINGELVSGYADLPPVPKNVPRSQNYPALVRFYHADYHGKPIRIAALLQPVYDDSMRGITLIQVAETLDARRGLSNQILFDTLIWQAAMILVMGALVWFAVRLVLRPLMRLKTEVETRTLSDLSDVDPTLVHKEMRPLVSAMNGSMSRLQQLIASQRRFIADASHQLRTPLTVLKTQAELAMRECDRQAGTPPDIAALRDIVRSIAVTTDSTVLLANRLLTLARIEHGGENLAMDTVPLRDVAQQVGLEMAMAAVGKNIDLSLEAPDEAPVHGQALLLHELVANLVDNALRYTPPGGSVILRARAGGPGNETLLEVEDSGAGIPPSEHERVFTPFYRVGAALESNPGGAGLGLAIVRDIAALHGARLELATAANGHGLKVGVYFAPAPVDAKIAS